MPEFEAVKIVIANSIWRLTMNRPGYLIAFNEKMTPEIQSVLKNFASDKNVRCVSITGSGRISRTKP